MRISDWSSDVCSSDLAFFPSHRTSTRQAIRTRAAMTPEQREHFRQRLLALKRELGATEATASDAAKPVELDQTSVGRVSRMDAMQGQAMALAVQQRRAQSLRRIDAALARIDSGDYGDRKSTRLNSSQLCASRMPTH